MGYGETVGGRLRERRKKRKEEKRKKGERSPFIVPLLQGFYMNFL
jgi:hypothetical protein